LGENVLIRKGRGASRNLQSEKRGDYIAAWRDLHKISPLRKEIRRKKKSLRDPRARSPRNGDRKQYLKISGMSRSEVCWPFWGKLISLGERSIRGIQLLLNRRRNREEKLVVFCLEAEAFLGQRKGTIWEKGRV